MRNSWKILSTLALAAVFSIGCLAMPELEKVESGAEVAAGVTANLSDETQSELLFYQDFDHLPVGTYDSGAIASMLTGTEGAKIVDLGTFTTKNVQRGCTFEVAEENGNKFLKVTGQMYQALAVEIPEAQRLLFLSFNYKYPENSIKNTLTMVRATSDPTKYVETPSSWNGSNPLLDSTGSDWAASTSGLNSLMDSGNSDKKYVGFGFNNALAGTTTIYIDDLTVWSFNVGASDAIHSAVSKTITFKNQTGMPEATMPENLNCCVWCNYYDGQKYNTSITVNLNNIVPATVPVGYEFAGWSTSDGGSVVKDCQYSSFRVPGEFTFYATWKKAKPVVKFEDFESYEVGHVFTKDELNSLILNNTTVLGAPGCTFTIVEDSTTGGKCLKITGSAEYANFCLNPAFRSRDNATEYRQFDYRFENTSGRFIKYKKDSGDSSHQTNGELAISTSWGREILSLDSNYNYVGFFIQKSTSFTLYIDNYYYWSIPNGLEQDDKRVTVTFKNSTVNAPQSATLPTSLVKNLWETKDVSENYVNLKNYKATSDNAAFNFLGWSRTDGGKVINVGYDVFRCMQDETLYAVWEVVTPSMTGKTSIRTGSEKNQSIRFQATISVATFNGCDEFGFLASRAGRLGDDELTFALDNTQTKKYVSKAVDKDKVTADPTQTELLWSVVLKSIPKTKENFEEILIVRPYIKIGGTTYYGTEARKTILETAQALIGAGQTGEYLDEIIDICNGTNA